MVGEWIAQHRRLLRILWVVFLFVWVGELFVLRSKGAMTLDPEILLLFLVAPILFGTVHLMLMHVNWFKPLVANGPIATIKHGIFWTISVAFAIAAIGLVVFVARS